MGGIRNNVRRKIYPEVEIDDDIGVRLGMGVVGSKLIAAVTSVVMVGVDDAGPGFFVGAAYVKMVCWRSR